jgi:DNA invertase Pin-like site-specific DNA recombinase
VASELDASRAVLYAAKSTEDVRGSIPTQLEDCRALAEHDGLKLAGEFTDEAASAYSGDRGSGLATALAECERLVTEGARAALIVQHSDRLARGDGRKSKHLVEYALWAIKHDVTILSVQDPQTFGDLLYAVVTGQRNNEDSKRKGAAVSAGQRRRFESGKRLGSPIRDGYRLELEDIARDGRPIRHAVLDPDRAPVWRRIFDLVEMGHTPGEIRQTLNAEGVRMKSGKPWTTRAVRRGVLDDWYAGKAHAYGQALEGDHEPLIEPDRWERSAATIDRKHAPTRIVTSHSQRDWLLRGIANCGRCGEKLYTRSDRRQYVCKAVREGHGTCDAPPIPAEQAERVVLDHLDDFVGGVEEWLAGQTRAAVSERDQFAESLRTQRQELRKLDLRAQRANQLADKLLDEGDDGTAAAALRKAEATLRDRGQLAEAIQAAEARLADWPTAPDLDAALDFYNELRDTIRGRLSGSESVSDLRAHLRAMLAEARLDYDGTSLFGTFFLRVSDPSAPAVVQLANGPVLDPIELDREAVNTTA